MLDSGASHNLMLKAIMEKLGLEITHKYDDLYSFDYGRVQCIGLIKELVVSRSNLGQECSHGCGCCRHSTTVWYAFASTSE